MAKKQLKYSSTPLSQMSREDKEFFRDMMDTIKPFYCQREALVQIVRENVENWEPVYRILQSEPEIVRKADELFAGAYESIDAGARVPLAQYSKETLTKWKPN